MSPVQFLASKYPGKSEQEYRQHLGNFQISGMTGWGLHVIFFFGPPDEFQSVSSLSVRLVEVKSLVSHFLCSPYKDLIYCCWTR